jgi:DNA polymerase III delta prime subunit
VLQISCNTDQQANVGNGEKMNYSEIDFSDIEQKYTSLEKYIEQMAAGNVRSLIVNGPPGVGKTYSASAYIKKYSKQKHKSVTGHMSMLTLYGDLYRLKNNGEILILDDVDSVMNNIQGLNILKAAMDTRKQREISWESTSALLEKMNLPNSFKFNGAVILITNTGFGNGGKKNIEHLNALKDRSFCLNLGDKDKETVFKYICFVTTKKDLLKDYGFNEFQKKSILEFIEEHMHVMHHLSLRSLVKCADLMSIDSDNWKNMAFDGLVKV